jgi:hypothetical protein
MQMNLDDFESAGTVIQSQRLKLCSKAEELVGKSISLYDCGVLLGVIPSNPRLRYQLASALEIFRFQLATEMPSGDGTSPNPAST